MNLQEVLVAADAASLGESLVFPELLLQYVDHQLKASGNVMLAKELECWKKELANLPVLGLSSPRGPILPN